MASERIFAYVSSPSLARKLQLRGRLQGLVHVTGLPPWLDTPRPRSSYACAFLEASASTEALLPGWLTSLSVLHPGLEAHIIAPKGSLARLRKTYKGRLASVLPMSVTRASLERIAGACLGRRKAGRSFGLTRAEWSGVAARILSNMSESAFLIQDGIILEATVTVFYNLGYTRETLIGRHFLEFLDPEERQKVAANYAARMSGAPTPERYETLVTTTSGEKVPVELIVGRTMFRGRPAAVGTIRDVSDRHALIEMQKRRETELQLIQRVTHSLISGRSLNEAIEDALDLVIDALGADAGTVVLLEPQGEFLPVAARQRSGRGHRTWSACGKADQISVLPDVLSRLRSGQAMLSAPCELTRTLGDHHLVAPLSQGGKLRGFFYVMRKSGQPFSTGDASLLSSISGEASLGVENRRLYEDLQKSYADLLSTQRELLRRERLAVIGNMAAHVAHEIRNPVATIMNATGQIRRRIDLQGVEAELADIIEEELERLRRLCDDLVMFSRQPTPIHRTVLLDGFLDFVRSDLVKSRLIPETISTSISVTPPDLSVSHDPDILYALLRNLVMNSVQSMGSSGTLSLSASLSDSLVIEVSDTGPGIPSDVIPRIFDPFFSTKPEAAGLGLAIVKNYVEELGGDLDVVSEPSRGTTIRLRLPPSHEGQNGL